MRGNVAIIKLCDLSEIIAARVAITLLTLQCSFHRYSLEEIMLRFSLVLLCSTLAFPVDAQKQGGFTPKELIEMHCNNSTHPPDWPQNCIDAYNAHATNVSSFSPEDRRALIQYLDEACPDCHNSFVDFYILCGKFDEAVGEFWRNTYCLRDDVRESNEYCQVIIYDLIDTTAMDEEYSTECADLRSGGTVCSSGCRDVLMRTRNSKCLENRYRFRIFILKEP